MLIHLAASLFFSLSFTHKHDIPGSIYDFKIAGLKGGVIDFSEFRGKKILIVNTASHCGNTSQYEKLEKLYKDNAEKLVVVGFPANNFMWQEPGSNERIAEFCQSNYNITFPMAAKISVRGRNKAPIYCWLTNGKYNGYRDSKVKWNFQKYLINEHGKLTGIFPPGMQPDDPDIIAALK